MDQNVSILLSGSNYLNPVACYVLLRHIAMKWEISVQVLPVIKVITIKGEQGITETAGRMNITPGYCLPV